MKNLSDLLPRVAAPAKKSSRGKSQKSSAKPRRRWILGSALAALIFVVVASTGLAVAHFSDKILPGVSVAGINLGGKTREEAAAELQQQTGKLDIVIQNGATTWQPTPQQLGIEYDLSATVNDAFQEGRIGTVQQRLGALSGRSLPLKFRYNTAATDEFITNIVHATSKDPVDAALVVRNGTIQVSPEQQGQTTGVENAAEKIRSAAVRPSPLSLTISEITLHPNITAADLTTPLQQAQAMAAIPVTITSGTQNLSPSEAQRAGWLVFSPDPTNHTVKVTFDSSKIQAFVSSLVKGLTTKPVSQEIGVNKDENGAASIIQAGHNGQMVSNAADLSSGLLAALTAGKAFTGSAVTAPVQFPVVQMTIYDRWIEVNLTQQRMIAWEKGTPVLNVLISSGIPMFPTPTGTFHIYGKSRVTEMKGELGTPFAYDLPNVQWVSWWMGSYSIHGTYWHHNFGHVMSHGCINATNADAEFIYNWAPVGTAVVIHR